MSEPMPAASTAPAGAADGAKQATPSNGSLTPAQGQAKPSDTTPTSGTPSARPPIAKARDRYNQQSLGASLNSKVKQSRVLMVGAGGIGCELLKNLAMSGFGEITIVDLDTIDLSNLNRQFLFRHEHIKKSKALVAKEAAQRFNPNVKLEAHHANIKDAEFNVAWFRQFAIVFNALDNLEARRHVNKMCIAADVPLVESGTTGFNGQVQVIKQGVTACYDCTPKEAPKSFPVCTIRSTPSQPIHCIVWGKSYLLSEMFGTSEDQSAFDHSADAENAQEVEELKRESEALKKIRGGIGTPEFAQMLFDKVFHTDIERLRTVEDMWKSRRPPEPLKYNDVMARSAEVQASRDSILADDQKVWTLEESLVVFNDSIDRLSRRIAEMKNVKDSSKSDLVIAFDKDDIDTLDFVAASANIRSTIFGIDRKSRFDIKQMAGNIIPAIATTNAIVAGLCVLQSFKILKGDYGQAKEVFLTPFGDARLLAPDRAREPNPECPVCSAFNTSVEVDLTRATLDDMVKAFKEKLGFGEREFIVSNDVGILYDADELDNLPKKIIDLGIVDGSFITINDDEDEDTLVNVVVNVQKADLPEDGPAVKTKFETAPEIPRRPAKALNGTTNGHSEQNGTEAVAATPAGIKRSSGNDSAPPAKKVKVTSDNDDVVVVDDSANGAIVIDD